MNLRVTVQPTEEPVSVNELKAHLRIDGDDENDLLAGYLTGARMQCELEARRAFVTQTLQLKLEAWPCWPFIILPRPPLQSVTSIVYVDNAGASTTMSASDYIVDATGEPGRVWLGYGLSWPSATLRPGPSITITYVAGYGDAVDVPQIYKQAIMLVAGHYYENREAIVIGQGFTATQVPMAAQALLMVDRGAW
jgi:uncharacterized phiE125 gp8 family phage protein